MADRKWTDKQKEAISYSSSEHGGKGVIVSAAAGSGKTAVIVERIKGKLMRGEVNADELIISTFTRKAADEMKLRLENALEEELAKDPDNDKLLEQRLRLNDANISTIDSFCSAVLKRYGALSDELPAKMNVLEQTETELLLAQAIDDVLENMYDSSSGYFTDDQRDLIYDWYDNEGDSRLFGTLKYMYRFSEKLLDPDTFFSEQLEVYRDPEHTKDNAAAVLNRYISSQLGEGLKNMHSLVGMLALCVPADDKGQKIVNDWNKIAGQFDGICNGIVTDISARARNALTQLEGLKNPSAPKKTDDYDNEEAKGYNASLRSLRTSLTNLLKPLSFRDKDMLTAAPVLELLIKLTRSIGERYRQLKRDRGGVDFTDIELMTLGLLRDENGEPSDIAKEIAAKTAEIIVDEFQDSNEIQYEIFRLISKNKSNLYFVGDVKQSIYRFRGADPLVFKSLSEDTDSYEPVQLNANFRSCEQVVNSVNCIFTGQMTEECGDVDYNDDCKLIRKAEYLSDDKNNVTEFAVFEAEKKPEAREKEAQYIARRIYEMVNGKDPFMLTVRDKETGSMTKRRCSYGDFAILMENYSGSAYVYKNALEEAGVPFIAKEEKRFTEMTEIKYIISLLKVLDDPYKDLELAMVLMHEPYLMPAEDIAKIKLRPDGSGTAYKHLWTGLREHAGIPGNDRIKAAFDEISGYMSYARDNSPERVLRKIFDESMVIPAAAASPGGDKRVESLYRLLSYAKGFSEGESAGLCDLIDLIESINKRDVKIAPTDNSSSADAVKMMTIHASKGLEFPVCFVVNLSTGYGGGNKEHYYIECDSRCGIGMKVIRRNIEEKLFLEISTMPYEMVKAEIKRLDLSESMRKLYVAATRAEEKLIFTVPKGGRFVEGRHYKWVSSAAEKFPQYIAAAKELDETDEPQDAAEDEEPLKIKYRSAYAAEDFTKIPAKVSATQIGVRNESSLEDDRGEMDRYLRTPSFLLKDEGGKLTGKKRGDAYHKVMEHIDFSTPAERIPDVIEEMVRLGQLSEAERDCIEVKDIENFLESDICLRARNSGNIYREYPIFCRSTPKPGDWDIDDWESVPESDRPMIQGIVDMFFIENGQIILVDYKKHKADRTTEQLIEEYKGQLEIYSAALTTITGLPVAEKMLYSFVHGVVPVV